MFDYDTVENVSNIITYNYYYGLFLTYVFPILLIILLIFIIGYLSSINKKLLISSNKEKKEIELLDENIENNDFTDSKKQPKTLYELTLIPALICLSIFLIMFFIVLFSFL